MKKIFSLILVVVLVFSISIVSFAETQAFSKSFETVEQMCEYITKYAADYPNVDYSDELTTPIKSYELKQKALALISIDNDDYTLSEIICGETKYNYGINNINFRYTKGDVEINISTDYFHNSESVTESVDYFASSQAWDHEFCCVDSKIYIGEVQGYYCEGIFYSSHDKTIYLIAADDVLIEIEYNGTLDENLLNSLQISRSDILMPVLEYSPSAPIKVTDEVLTAARLDYDNEDIAKEDLTVTDYYEFDNGHKLVRLTVAGYQYTDDEVEQRIGGYVLTVPQRPLPKMLINGEFYDIAQAYEASMITDDDLEENFKYSFSTGTFSMKKYKEVKGDVDGDDRLTILDATYVQRYTCKYEDLNINLDRADFNADDAIDVFDATAMQRSIAGYK
ncbi:MAG: dockerin type I repeat-containing protein [Eubacteriales bacterium]|nr:dockerin type I repeat-containing protein [Eubacteriales bacterium]